MESKKGYTVVLMALQPLDPSEKKPHIYAASQYYWYIFLSDHPEIICADNLSVGLKLEPLIMELWLIISWFKLIQELLVIGIAADFEGKASLIHNRKSHKGILV